MARSIFISYRREDTAAQAQSLERALAHWFGDSEVFLDQRSIPPGEPFPQDLHFALSGARAVLVLIGPRWLPLLTERAARPAEHDWVRHEVALALRRATAKDLPLLLPILVHGATAVPMPGEADWPEALHGELSSLSAFNADTRTFATREPDVTDLRWHLLRKTGLPYCLTHDARQVLADRGRELQLLLEHGYGLDRIARHWPNPPTSPGSATDLPKEISRFRGALEKALPNLWPLPPEERVFVAESCRDVLSLLYRMCVDEPITREWQQGSGSRRPIPAGNLATAVIVRAEAERLPVHMGPAVGDHPGFDRVIDVRATDPGIGDDETARIHRLAWAQATALGTTMPYPVRDGQTLAGDHLKQLLSALADDADAGRPHMLAQQVDTQAMVPEATRALAASLGLPLTCFSPQDVKALRFEEADLHNRIRACLKLLEPLVRRPSTS